MSLLLLIAPVLAQDCDVRTLEKELEDASPASSASAFTALAACDGARAKKKAPDAFEKILSGGDANEAVIAAITIDAGDIARSWIGALQSDERSSAIAALGQACGQDEAVAGWLVQTQKELGDQFWSERWYRSLATCRVEEIQALLSSEIDNPSDDRARFTGVLEVYARNLGMTAIPRLAALTQELQAPQEIGLVINAFGDAAGLGSLEGANPEAVALASKTLVEIAPTLPPKLNDQMRSVLIALGDQDASDGLAAIRYAELVDGDGNLQYGLVAVSTQSCKKGKMLVVHNAAVINAGTLWPDQLEAPVRQAIDSSWDLSPGKKCTVEGDLEVFLTPTPVPDAPAVETFQAEQLEALAERGIAKQAHELHEALTLP